MFSISRLSRSMVFLGALLLLAGCGGGSDEAETPVLRYTAIPDQNSTELIQRFQPLTAYLSEKLEVPVEYVPARDYQASVEMFRNGDIMLAWFGGLTGVQARNAVPGAEAIAQGQADPQYYSYFIAHQSTGLERSEEFPTALADLTFSFGSESSTSGRLMPEYFIKQNTGKSPLEFFAQPFGFSGSHDKTCKLVESGQFPDRCGGDRRCMKSGWPAAIWIPRFAGSSGKLPSTPITISRPTPSWRRPSAPVSRPGCKGC